MGGVCAAAPAAPVGIVDLHHAGQLPGAVTFEHRLHLVVLHQPGAVLRDTELAGQFQREDAVEPHW